MKEIRNLIKNMKKLFPLEDIESKTFSDAYYEGVLDALLEVRMVLKENKQWEVK